MDHHQASRVLRERLLADTQLRSAVEYFTSQGAVFLPGSGNMGDALIQLGTFDYFEEIGRTPQVVRGMSSDVLNGHRHVILGGGGGWIEGRYEYYPEILTPFLDAGGELLILPSTFWGFQSFLRRYAAQITVFAREQPSFDAIAAVSGLQGLYLADDMAFATRPERLRRSSEEILAPYQLIKILRRDGEAAGPSTSADSIDFPIIFNNTQWISADVSIQPLLAAAKTLELFRAAETDRLHMAILAAMLGLQVTFRDNSYFKNRGVFERSLCSYGNVTMVPKAELPLSDERPDLNYADRARLLSRIEFLNSELQASRRRNAWLIQHRQPPSPVQAVGSAASIETDPMLASFRKSRGFRVWMAYNRLYEHHLLGRPMKLARRVAAKARRLLVR